MKTETERGRDRKTDRHFKETYFTVQLNGMFDINLYNIDLHNILTYHFTGMISDDLELNCHLCKDEQGAWKC